MRYIILLWCFVTIYSCSEKQKQITFVVQSDLTEDQLPDCHFELNDTSTIILPFSPIRCTDFSFSPFESNKIWFWMDNALFEYDLLQKKHYPVDSLFGQNMSNYTFSTLLKDNFSDYTWFLNEKDSLVQVNRKDGSVHLKNGIGKSDRIFATKDHLIIIKEKCILAYNRISEKVDTLQSPKNLEQNNLSSIFSYIPINNRQMLIDKDYKTIYDFERNIIFVDSTFLKHSFYKKLGNFSI